jgi:hypothetical protein
MPGLLFLTSRFCVVIDTCCCLQALSIVGILQDETDPMVSVMKVKVHTAPFPFSPVSISMMGAHLDICTLL